MKTFRSKNLILMFLILVANISLSAASLDSGLSDDKVREFFSKLSASAKQEIIDNCKKDLGAQANGKSDSQLVDLCIAKAKSNIDPLDNYIDPDTLIDYSKEFDSYSEDKRAHILNRCTMFVIQNEMGQSGEASMTNAEIESYEAKVMERCKAVLNKKIYGENCSEATKDECEKAQTLKSKQYDIERDGDLLTFTLDQCTQRMQVTDDQCKAEGGALGPTCTLDFRRQCFDFITQESTYFEDPKREINTCANFEDQTRTLAVDCRSYCYMKQVCDITDEKFTNREIGNIYLRKKLGSSSCVKNKSFGIEADGKIWVHQSCHGEFGIQYKEPDCGYRPTCEASMFEPESIQTSGRDETFVTCDGNDTAVANTPSTGIVWCKANLYKKDQNGKLTDEIDDDREITNISNVALEEKLGVHACNPGGNGAAVDYTPKNKGNFDGGWGVEVTNYCHGRFKLQVAWKQKSCTMAGQKSISGNTCCNGLIHDPETKVCNVPEFIPEPIAETAQIPVIGDRASGAKCDVALSEDIVTKANDLFKELAVYENMFTILDGESDPIKKISLEVKSEEEIPQNRKLNNAAIKVIHDGAVAFRAQYAKIKIEHEEISNKIACDMNEYMLIKSVELGEERFKELDIEKEKCPVVGEKYKEVVAYFEAVKANVGSQDPASGANKNQRIDSAVVTAPVMSQNNLLKIIPDIQEASQKAQTMMIEANIVYLSTLVEAFDVYVKELEVASLTGQNLVWYCAHKENCSEFNWLVKHALADKYEKADDKLRLEYRVITDFMHNPIFPTKLISSKSKILPELEVGFKKYLYDSSEYLKSETEIAKLDAYKPVINYFEGKMEEIAQPEWYKSIFQLYGQEYPLRSNSLLAQDDIFAQYVEKFEASTKFSRGEIVDNKSQVIPYLCENQKKTNFQVRVPMGKALIPLRMVQITEFLYKYMQAQKDILNAQYTCTPEYKSTDGGSGNSNNSQGSVSGSGILSNLLRGTGSTSYFGASNTLAQRILGVSSSNSSNTMMKGKKNNVSIKETSGNIDVADVSFVSARKDRAEKNKKLIDLAKSKRNDKLIGKYTDSLGRTYGSALNGSKQSVFGKLGNSFLNSGVKSGSGSNSLDSSKSGNNAYSNNGNGSGGAGGVDGANANGLTGGGKYSGGAGLKGKGFGGSGFGKGSKGSGSRGSYGGSSGASGSSESISGGKYGNSGSGSATGLSNSDQSEILNNLGNSEYEAAGDDTLFDMITKRYIKSAYPQFMSPNTKKEIDE